MAMIPPAAYYVHVDPQGTHHYYPVYYVLPPPQEPNTDENQNEKEDIIDDVYASSAVHSPLRQSMAHGVRPITPDLSLQEENSRQQRTTRTADQVLAQNSNATPSHRRHRRYKNKHSRQGKGPRHYRGNPTS